MSHKSIASLFLSGLAVISLSAGCASSKGASSGRSASAQAQNSPSSDGQPAGQAMRLFEDALVSFDEQKSLKVFDWAFLEKKFSAALAADSQFAEAHYNLGIVHEKMHRSADAILDYQRALQLKPYFREAAENLANLLQHSGQTAEAITLMQNMLKLYPDDGAVQARLAAIYQAASDTKQAMHFARETLIRDPKNLMAYKVMMNCYMDRNNLDMARLVAMRATKLKADDPELFYTMGIILERQDDHPGAMYQYLKATQIQDDFLRARIRIAQIAINNSDWSTAALQYQKIVQYDPTNMDARLNLGICYKGLGEIDKAMGEYDAVLKSNNPLPLAHYAMGVLFQAHKEEPQKAMEHYREFIAKSQTTVPANHAVFGRVKECEQTIREAEEARAAEERAAKEAELERQRLEEQQRIEAENLAAAQKAEEEAEKAKRQKAAQDLLDGKSAEDSQATEGDGQAEATQNGSDVAPQGEQSPSSSAANADDDADDGDEEDGPEENGEEDDEPAE